MWPNLWFPSDLVTFTEEILKGKFDFLCSGASVIYVNETEKGNINTTNIVL